MSKIYNTRDTMGSANEDETRPRPPGRPKGSLDDRPRLDDRDRVEAGLYPDDLKRLKLIADVRGCSQSEAIRWCIARAAHHIAT